MKLPVIIGFLIFFAILAGVLLLRPPASPPARRTARKPVTKSPSPPRPRKLVAGSRRPQERAVPADPEMAAMRQAVRRYVAKNPGLTAQVMQDWMKKKK